MFKVVRYDRIPTARATVHATFIYHNDAIIDVARKAMGFAKHGRHIEFVKGGFNIMDDYNKVSVAFKIETEEN